MEAPVGKSRKAAVVVIILIAVASVAAWFFVQRHNEESRRIQVEAAIAQIELKNRGIGFLENGDHNDADNSFSTLVTQLPHETLGRRNLAISRLLAIEKLAGAEQSPEQLQGAIENARRAIDELLTNRPQDAESHLLAADLADKTKDKSQQFEQLSTAAELSPDDARIHFKLYLALRYSTDDDEQEDARSELEAAAKLAPDNLFVLPQWLSAQATAKDPAIVETLQRARKLLAPFAANIETRTRFDLLDAIDKSLAAVEMGDWATVTRNVAGIGNVVRPEPMSHIDRARINPHLLEYVAFDFSEQFYTSADLPPRAESNAIPVQFVAQTESQLPTRDDVLDLELSDFNLDGDLELILLTDAAISIWERDPQSGQWSEIVTKDLPAGMRGVIAADLDRDDKETPPRPADDIRPCLDADVDLVVFGDAGLLVLQNKLNQETGQRSLDVVPQDDGLSALKNVLTAALADVDHDGDLDLVVSAKSGVSVWSNRDDFTFADISNRSALPPDGVRPTKIVPVDWNRDVSLDLVLVDGSSGKAGYLENLMHGRLRWREFAAEFELPQQLVSFDVAELDGNASWDLVAVDETGIQTSLTQTLPGGRVTPRQTEKVATPKSSGLLTWDYDNDGRRDVLSWGGESTTLLRGSPDGQLSVVANPFDGAGGPMIDCVIGDVDGDGDLDLLTATVNGVALYDNEGGNANGWIDVSLSADPNKRPSDASKRVNMHGIGSLLELKAGRQYQAQVVTGKTTHFGLGTRNNADVMRVLWTNGVPENRVDPKAKTAICAKQDLKGSCPYLYTWDGERYSFMTDLLWSSPIGLQFAEGVLAPARAWEYLKIPGDRLQPADGEYRLQITEELWEAAYFDRVQLIAVDHPAEIDIFTNEKVGPPQIAEHKIHTVRNPLVPVAATDKHGRDVLPQIAARDDDYLKAYDGRILQGLTDQHFVELDLGQLENPKQIMLYLSGWVFPTDTSLNVAISQNPRIAPPQPPSIHIPDDNGGWEVAIPYTGFPGGKTKTIAIDVSHIFKRKDYRLRLVSSMQLCWDQMFFTVDEQPADVKTTELELISADLHYRGFNRRIEHPGHGPESYDYEQVDTQPKWPPMAGRFTRYGDVAPLLDKEDDQLVVLGAGDEMTLRFRVPEEPLPKGWQRDFVLYNVGWDKDADLNTVYGQAVEPLPFRAMRRYPFPIDQPAPDTRDYRSYLKQYQTREQNFAEFWKLLSNTSTKR